MEDRTTEYFELAQRMAELGSGVYVAHHDGLVAHEDQVHILIISSGHIWTASMN